MTPRTPTPPLRPRPHWSLATGLVLAVAVGIVAAVTGCSSAVRGGSAPSSASSAAPTTPGAPDTDTTELALGGGHVLAAGEVTCHLAKREQGGIIGTDVGRVETSCDERHNEESFTLAGTSELDDCYRAVAASSDVAIAPDSFDPTKLEFNDERIMGHTFATSGDGTTGAGGVTCALDLRDDRSTPLLAASS